MENARDMLDQEACHRAVLTRDPRFDGRFFTCVKTTGIYCRPVCPARTPKRENMSFVASAAAAEEAGFRACLRCRPETAPDMGAWRGTSNTVSRALNLIEAGALDEGDVDALAARLGVGERHLRRLFRQHLGAAPVSVAQTRRILLAKALIHQTDLPMAEVALASGFGSVRRFNETFQALYGRPPSSLRQRTERPSDGGVRLSLPYRPPYDVEAMLSMLAARGETIENGVWRRDLIPEIDQAAGRISARFEKEGRLAITAELDDLKALPGVLARVRRLFDLSADPEAIRRDLSVDPLLRPLVEARPGLRLPGAWIDQGADLASDRAPDDWNNEGLTARAETWRPWRAYGVLHLHEAGVDGAAVMMMETRDEKDAA
ncbi:bifunctional transcriptional activator/DNA repair enzyme AdaA [Brevundimonas faecalis]|uniref:AraC family transcriptional regulator of adaptative response / DNA-3-methyladenine glycosylase II n=1 Tax=Brevundimonas faecalis TaxID=947378 RepID=A0ABV2RFK3_9CAUL